MNSLHDLKLSPKEIARSTTSSSAASSAISTWADDDDDENNNNNSPVPSLLTTPSAVLAIDALGIGCGGLSASSQLSTPIYRGTHVSSAEPAYVSERPSAKSNSAVLRRADGRGEAIATTYRAGFGEPKIGRLGCSSSGLEHGLDVGARRLRYGIGECAVEVKPRWWSNKVTLKLDEGMELEWKYFKTHVRSPQSTGKRKRVMALVRKGEGREEVLAVLLRTKHSRTAGTSRWSAGNGGLLYLDECAERILDEPVIVATCLMMLKREVDNTSSANAAAIS